MPYAKGDTEIEVCVQAFRHAKALGLDVPPTLILSLGPPSRRERDR